MSYKISKNKKYTYSKFTIFSLLGFIFIIVLIFLNFYLKVQQISFEFFDEKVENQEIKNFTENVLRQEAKNYFGFVMLDEKEITKVVHGEFETVSDVLVSKDLKMNLNVTVKKNQEFFYTCAPEEYNFLVRCMLGNSEGVFYKEIENEEEKVNKLNIEINKLVLFEKVTGEKIDEPDSLSGSQIYQKQDFTVLREIINWLKNNGFVVNKVYVDELKIVNVYTDGYFLKINLEKGYAETVKDFELISRTGELQKYINEDKNKIEYIDLSFNNKVFYRLKNGNQTNVSEQNSTTSAATTTIINN